MQFPKHDRRDSSKLPLPRLVHLEGPSPRITGFGEIARVESAPRKTLGPTLLLGGTQLARKAIVTPRIWLGNAFAISAR